MAAERECVYVLFERHMCKFDVIDDKPANELEIVVDFESESLPMFMAPFVLNSKLYMIGGLHLQRITSDLGYFEKLVIAQSSAGDDGLNRCVYLLDPTGPQMSKYCRADIPSPQAPKPGPKVFVIDSKVYLLGSFDYHYCQKLPYPAFECFDPQDNSWTTLPEPPFYRDNYKWDGIINSHAFGRNIFVSNDIFSAGGLQYNVDECEWKYRDWLPYCTMSSTLGGCCVEQTDKNGLAVVFTKNGPLVFHLAPDGTPMRWQYLSNLYSLTGFPTVPDIRINGNVSHIRDEKYCLLISRYYGISHILYVAIFQLKVKKTHAQDGEKYDLGKVGEQDFTDSHLLYTRQYNIQFADNPTIRFASAMIIPSFPN